MVAAFTRCCVRTEVGSSLVLGFVREYMRRGGEGVNGVWYCSCMCEALRGSCGCGLVYCHLSKWEVGTILFSLVFIILIYLLDAT